MAGVKQKSLSLKTKLAILDDVDKKVKSKTQVAKDYGIPKSTLSTILKNRQKIQEAGNEGFAIERKRIREAAFPQLEDALIQWVKKLRSQNIPVDGNLLKTKAEEFALRMNLEDQFKFSDGWIQNFKKRYNLTFRKVCGESAAAEVSVAKEWIENKLKRLMRDYPPENVYNADETGLFYKLLPNRTFTFKNEKCSGGKLSKLRITVMLAVNMTGTDKLKPFVIGKSAKPRCFKGIQTLPVKYAANKKAWMTEVFYADWLHELDRKFLAQNRKVLLIVDNCSAHGNVSDLKAIHIEFLPPNLTSIMQPLDQGIIQAFKTNYRKSLLKRVIIGIENEKEYEVSLLSAIYMVAAAWDAISEKTIVNCFNHAGFGRTASDEATSGEALPKTADNNSEKAGAEGDAQSSEFAEIGEGEHLLEILRKRHKDIPDSLSFEEYANADKHVECNTDLTDEEIIRRAKKESEQILELSSDEEEGSLEVLPPPSVRQASEAAVILRRFFEAQENSDRFLSVVMQLERKVLSSAFNFKQTKITDFVVQRKPDA